MTDPDYATLERGLERATDSLDAVRDELRLKFFTARRAIRLALGVAIAVGVFAGGGILANRQQTARINDLIEAKERERVGDAVVACRNSNETRARLLGLFGVYTDTLGNLTAPPTPEGQARTAGLVAKLRADFVANVPPELGPRDCSPEAVSTPTTFPPPTTLAVN